MSIDMKIPRDLDRLNCNELGELIWWSAHLSVGPEKLLCVINKVGTAVKDIRRYLVDEK